MKKFHADLIKHQEKPADAVDGTVPTAAESHEADPTNAHKPAVKTAPSKYRRHNGSGKGNLKPAPANRRPNHPPTQGEIAHE